jgi:hypothetical protein
LIVGINQFVASDSNHAIQEILYQSHGQCSSSFGLCVFAGVFGRSVSLSICGGFIGLCLGILLQGDMGIVSLPRSREHFFSSPVIMRRLPAQGPSFPRTQISGGYHQRTP